VRFSDTSRDAVRAITDDPSAKSVRQFLDNTRRIVELPHTAVDLEKPFPLVSKYLWRRSFFDYVGLLESDSATAAIIEQLRPLPPQYSRAIRREVGEDGEESEALVVEEDGLPDTDVPIEQAMPALAVASIFDLITSGEVMDFYDYLSL